MLRRAGKRCIYGPTINSCKRKCISANLANRLTNHKYKFKQVYSCLKHFKEMISDFGGE